VTNPPVCQPAIRPYTEVRSHPTEWHLEGALPDRVAPEGETDLPAAQDLLQHSTAANDTNRSQRHRRRHCAGVHETQQLNEPCAQTALLNRTPPAQRADWTRLKRQQETGPEPETCFHTGLLTKTPSKFSELLTPTEVEDDSPAHSKGSEKHRPQKESETSPHPVRLPFQASLDHPPPKRKTALGNQGWEPSHCLLPLGV